MLLLKTSSRLSLQGTLLGFLMTTSIAAPVYAVQFNTILKEKSALTFVSKQMNVPVEGKFKTFMANLSFDPAKLATARVRIDIDTKSIEAGSDEANDEVKGKDWFDVKTYPNAHFVSTQFTSLGKNRYQVTGMLTIKGTTKQVTAPFTFIQKETAGIGQFDGGFTIKRGEYGIGQGSWAEPSIVAEDVRINFHLEAGVGLKPGMSAKK